MPTFFLTHHFPGDFQSSAETAAAATAWFASVAQAWPLLARGGGVEVREFTLVKSTVPV